MMQISKSSPNHSNRQAPNQTFKGGKIYFVDENEYSKRKNDLVEKKLEPYTKKLELCKQEYESHKKQYTNEDLSPEVMKELAENASRKCWWSTDSKYFIPDVNSLLVPVSKNRDKNVINADNDIVVGMSDDKRSYKSRSGNYDYEQERERNRKKSFNVTIHYGDKEFKTDEYLDYHNYQENCWTPNYAKVRYRNLVEIEKVCNRFVEECFPKAWANVYIKLRDKVLNGIS